MDDVISRQVAIDLWEKYHPTIAVDAMQYDAELRQLPPAQPEQRWIPCDKGTFPKDGKEVLVTDGENMMVAYYRNDAEAWDNYNFGWVEGRNEEMPYGINKVIAWMPLPKSYRGEKKDEVD